MNSLLILVSLVALSQAAKPHVKCDRNYRKLGCFNDNTKALPNLLITDRSPSHPAYQGHSIDWTNWDQYIHSLACRCAAKAKKLNYKVFGLQNYGECWSGPGAEKEYARDKVSTKCISYSYTACNNKDARECVGETAKSFVYEVVEDDPCKSGPCKNGGTCTKSAGGFLCTCPSNYAGTTCEDDVNECVKSPCKNGATCSNIHGSFKCICAEGFKGKLCDKDVNECAKSPCKNGATCSNIHGSFKCICAKGFDGKLCDKDVNECAKSPCKNGATCSNIPGSFKCICAKGFEGKLCDKDVNECAKSPCKNGATCSNIHGSFKCICAKGFKGKLCDKDVNECAKSPCKNGATCSNIHGSFKCSCAKGFKGKLCDKDVNECAKSPCKNGATCSNIPGSFKCICAKGFKGKLCDKDINECAKSPCKNGATCSNIPGSFKCICAKGFKGKLCDKDVNECAKSPCKNGATCSNIPGSFKCICAEGFKGKLCDKACATPVVDLAIVVDGSGSVGNNMYMAIKRFLLVLVDKLEVGSTKTHVATIYYSDAPHIHGGFNDHYLYHHIKLKLSILGLPFPDGETRTDLALKMANEKLFTKDGGDRKSVPDVLVVITDGEHAPESGPIKDVLKPLKDHGVRVIAVGFDKSADHAGLLELASGNKKNVFAPENIEDLKVEDLVKAIKDSC